MKMTTAWGNVALENSETAARNVRQRLLRAIAALQTAKVPYAVAGDHAVAEWVGRIDGGAVRNMVDVEVVLRRENFPAAKAALESAGFLHRELAGIDVFLDGPSAKPRDAVHILFANEMDRPNEPAPNPDVSESEEGGSFRVLSLEALVRIKLTAFRRKDQMHLLDMIGVGLIDAQWLARLPQVLSDRLRQLLEDPER
jgi:hypothetical protein